MGGVISLDSWIVWVIALDIQIKRNHGCLDSPLTLWSWKVTIVFLRRKGGKSKVQRALAILAKSWLFQRILHVPTFSPNPFVRGMAHLTKQYSCNRPLPNNQKSLPCSSWDLSHHRRCKTPPVSPAWINSHLLAQIKTVKAAYEGLVKISALAQTGSQIRDWVWCLRQGKCPGGEPILKTTTQVNNHTIQWTLKNAFHVYTSYGELVHKSASKNTEFIYSQECSSTFPPFVIKTMVKVLMLF